MFDRQLVTKAAMLSSSAVQRVVDGYQQIVVTSEALNAGCLLIDGLDPSKPRYGIVVTFGEIPLANFPAVWAHAKGQLSLRNVTDSALSTLATVPQTLHGLALEMLLIALRDGVGTVPSLFAERATQPALAVGEWEAELAKACQTGRKHDLGFWKNPAGRLLDELGVGGFGE